MPENLADQHWDADYQEFASLMVNRSGDQPLFEQFRAVLDARMADTQEAAWLAARSTARWTKWLAAATVVLALATAGTAVAAFDAQRDAASEQKAQTCIARVSLSAAISEFIAPAFPNMSGAYSDYRDEVRDELVDAEARCD